MIPDAEPRQDRYCPVCGEPTAHRGLRTTIEEMVADNDMRPSGSIEAWICSKCGHRESGAESSGPAPTG